LTEYDRTKWMAHYQVALPLIERGAPITILMPGAVYGPGDTSLVGDLMRAFYMGLFPVLPGPELTLTYVHVEDVAQGHLLAAERGKPGEAYILTGPALSLHDAVHLLASVSGRAAPLFDVPARWLQPLAPVMGFLSGTLPIPPLMSQDTLQMLGATYIARADKARRELGWKARPVEEGFGETMDWIAGTTRPVLSGTTPRQQVAALSVGAALGLLLVWMAARRRR
jgi:nucleoside-diphosphate-sugar epimerase